jgi:creatinine amidohydrolase
MKLHLAEMTWPEVKDMLGRSNVVLIPVGSTEQHGPHLPLNVDSASATYLAEEAAQRVNRSSSIQVVVAPTLHYTEVELFSPFPGSVGISLQTETALISEVTRSFLRQGLKNLLFINGHYGNIIPISAALEQVSAEFPNAGIFALNWWALGSADILPARKSSIGLHADELETSLSLVIQPQNVQMDKAIKELPGYSLSEKWVKPDFYGSNKLFFHSRKKFPRMGASQGVMGDPTVASRETGEKIAAAVIRDLAEIIVEVAESEGKFGPYPPPGG